MILLIFIVSLALTSFCLRRKRLWKANNDKSAWYFFYDRCVEFFVPLTGVTFFYSVLWLLVDGTTSRTTLGWLETLEGVLASVESFVKHFKFTPLTSALIILGIIILDLLLSLVSKSGRAIAFYKGYNKWVKRVYTVAVLLCSFTFFGNQLGEERAHLRLRTDEIKQDYAKVRGEAENALYVSVQQKLYDKVRSSLPPEVRDYPDNINTELATLRSTYQESNSYGIRLPDTEGIIRRHEGRAKQAPDFSDKPIGYEEPNIGGGPEQKLGTSPDEVEPRPPSNLTVESVEKSLSEISTEPSLRTRAVSLIKSEGGKQLLCQFPKSLTGAVKSQVFKEAMKNYPLLEPVVDIFVGTYDKYVEEKVKKAADKLADKLLEHPEAAEQLEYEEAQRIVDSAEIKAPDSALEKIKKFVGRIKAELKEISDARQNVNSLTAEARDLESAKREGETASSTKRDQENGLVHCVCVCSRDNIPIDHGMMTDAQCNETCSGPC